MIDSKHYKIIIIFFKAFLIMILFTALPSASLSGTVSIVAPDYCVRLDKIENDRIYLIRNANNCIQATGLMQVQVKDGIDEVSIYLDGAFMKKQKVDTFNMSDISKFKAKSEQEKKVLEKTFKLSEDKSEEEKAVTIDVSKDTSKDVSKDVSKKEPSAKTPDNIHRKKAELLAKETDAYYRSDKFQTELKIANEMLKKRFNVNDFFTKPAAKQKTPYYNDYEEMLKSYSKPSLKKDERLYIFISSSVPVSTIRNYAVLANKIQDKNVIFVMRGFINGAKYIVPTIKFIAQIMKEDETCNLLTGKCEIMKINVMIDPILFAKYSIERVPSFVYARGVKVIDIEMSEGLDDNATASSYYKLSGDAGIDYILERFYEETKSNSIKELLYVWKKGFY